MGLTEAEREGLRRALDGYGKPGQGEVAALRARLAVHEEAIIAYYRAAQVFANWQGPVLGPVLEPWIEAERVLLTLGAALVVTREHEGQ